jgi:hypothetical protein
VPKRTGQVEPRREDVTGGWKNDVINSFVICTVLQILLKSD